MVIMECIIMAERKKINGKMYTEHGPFFCPNGCSWDDLKSMVKLSRIAGNSVRVKKYPENIAGNTHRVFFYARSWEVM
jgi:hypothetical protein